MGFLSLLLIFTAGLCFCDKFAHADVAFCKYWGSCSVTLNTFPISFPKHPRLAFTDCSITQGFNQMLPSRG
ncbi:hypothetical protein DL95DRAFT_387185 [Leptodontidium sp. 2 PMI_412]|nr:hypothetical protein DL95DRAFT_387185 [Leptodontidium sp. 2 PMI_412]